MNTKDVLNSLLTEPLCKNCGMPLGPNGGCYYPECNNPTKTNSPSHQEEIAQLTKELEEAKMLAEYRKKTISIAAQNSVKTEQDRDDLKTKLAVALKAVEWVKTIAKHTPACVIRYHRVGCKCRLEALQSELLKTFGKARLCHVCKIELPATWPADREACDTCLDSKDVETFGKDGGV